MVSRQSFYGNSTPPRSVSYEQSSYQSPTFMSSPQQYYRGSPPSFATSPNPQHYFQQPQRQSPFYAQRKSDHIRDQRPHISLQKKFQPNRSQPPIAQFTPVILAQRSRSGFEPMNTSPTIQQKQSHHSPTSILKKSASPPLAAVGNTSYYLPSFLSGESSFHHLSHSPPLGRSTSLRELGSSSSSGDHGGYGTGKLLFNTPPKTTYASAVAGSGPGANSSNAAVPKSAGPPIFGLGSADDKSPSPNSSPPACLLLEKSRLSGGSSGSHHGGRGGFMPNTNPQQTHPFQMPSTPPSSLSTSMIQLPTNASPQSQSPLTTSNWVTVFGFSPTATSYIISHFSQFGTITDTKSVPGSNWIHLKFGNKFEARRALNRNGTVVAGNMMVGIVPYEYDESKDFAPKKSAASTAELLEIQPLARERGPATSTPNAAASGSGSAGDYSNPMLVQDVKSRLRPLARVGYMGTNPLPQESNGIVSRALEFLFGW